MSHLEPILFGPDGASRFGALYHPGGRSRRLGAVVVPPFGADRVRSLRTLRRLCERLAAQGVATLRYDPLGSGDSSGHALDVSWSDWLAGLDLAVRELRARAGVARAVLVGARLGGALVWGASGRRDVDAVALWEPVMNGTTYVRALVSEHQAWQREELHARPGAAGYAGSHEVLGAQWSPQLRREIEAIRLVGPLPRRTSALLVAESCPDAFKLGRFAVWHQTREASVWSSESGMDGAPVSLETIDAVDRWIRGLR